MKDYSKINRLDSDFCIEEKWVMKITIASVPNI